jgi:hypothetical protein
VLQLVGRVGDGQVLVRRCEVVHEPQIPPARSRSFADSLPLSALAGGVPQAWRYRGSSPPAKLPRSSSLRARRGPRRIRWPSGRSLWIGFPGRRSLPEQLRPLPQRRHVKAAPAAPLARRQSRDQPWARRAHPGHSRQDAQIKVANRHADRYSAQPSSSLPIV